MQKNIKTYLFVAAVIMSFSFFTQGAKAAYNYYVDASSVEAQEDGSSQFPYKTINAAVAYINSNNLKDKSIFIKKGTYSESVTLIRNTSLFGEARHETILDAEEKKYGIYVGTSKSQIRNLTVKNAGNNLKITKKARPVVDNCSFLDSDANGVEVDKGSSKRKYEFIFKNSTVSDSGKRGIYIFRRKIDIVGNEIKNNGEEGIDLHTSVKGKIRDNKLEDNGEGGLELVVGGASLAVSGNTINGNHNSGIAAQIYSAANGKVKISRNTIKNNHKWGIRYVDFYGKKGHKFKSFIDSKVKLSKNTISGNHEGDSVYK